MRTILIGMCLCALVGCDDGGNVVRWDASGPSGTVMDATTPTPTVDAGGSTPTPSDAGTTPGPVDSGTTPAPVDSGTTTPPADSGTMSGGGTSVAPSADPRAGYIGCGSTSCMSPQICCVNTSGQNCTAAGGCGGLFNAQGTCDGPEDCPGQPCCVPPFAIGGMNGTFCQASCDGGQELCHSAADCDSGNVCRACQAPSGPGTTVIYGLCLSAGSSCPSPYTEPA